VRQSCKPESNRLSDEALLCRFPHQVKNLLVADDQREIGPEIFRLLRTFTIECQLDQPPISLFGVKKVLFL